MGVWFQFWHLPNTGENVDVTMMPRPSPSIVICKSNAISFTNIWNWHFSWKWENLTSRGANVVYTKYVASLMSMVIGFTSQLALLLALLTLLCSWTHEPHWMTLKTSQNVKKNVVHLVFILYQWFATWLVFGVSSSRLQQCLHSIAHWFH